MPSSVREFRVWCEDHRQEKFVRRFLSSEFGVDPRHDVKVFHAPDGKGAAEAWVIARYPDVERSARKARKQRMVRFLVVVDGDTKPGARQEALLGQPPRRDDRIGVWIPTRNIETWVLWLSGRRPDGREVDESASFKHMLRSESEFKDLVAQAVRNWHPPREAEESKVPSLTAARAEIDRIT